MFLLRKLRRWGSLVSLGFEGSRDPSHMHMCLGVQVKQHESMPDKVAG